MVVTPLRVARRQILADIVGRRLKLGSAAPNLLQPHLLGWSYGCQQLRFRLLCGLGVVDA